MKIKNLKPCPSCVSKDISLKCGFHIGPPLSLKGAKYWFVECLDCEFNTGTVFEDDVKIIYPDTNLTAEEIVIARWNRRDLEKVA